MDRPADIDETWINAGLFDARLASALCRAHGARVANGEEPWSAGSEVLAAAVVEIGGEA